MEAAEAIAKVEQWLVAVHGADPGVRPDHENVRQVVDGWSVPYNTTAFLDRGEIGKQIFPRPYLIVREPDGQLREASPQPGGLSIPARYPGQDYWREVVDPDYAALGLGHLGVPEAAIMEWRKVRPDGTVTDERRVNPEYQPGWLRMGQPQPDNDLEKLISLRFSNWIDQERLLRALINADVYVDLGKNGELPAGGDLLTTYTSTAKLPERYQHFWHVDIPTLAARYPDHEIRITGLPRVGARVKASEVIATLTRMRRFKPPVDQRKIRYAVSPEIEREVTRVAAELGLPEPVLPPDWPAQQAQKMGFELTEAEVRATARGRSVVKAVELGLTSWPADLEANGLEPWYDNSGRIVPRVNTFGKYLPASGGNSMVYGWQRVTGAYVGFALGEAMGLAVDRLQEAEIKAKFGPRGVTGLHEPTPIGSLTQRLLFLSEGAMRSQYAQKSTELDRIPEAAAAGLRRWLHSRGEQVPGPVTGWLADLPELRVQQPVAEDELAAIRAMALDQPGTGTGPAALLAALPAAITAGATADHLIDGQIAKVTRGFAGLTHGEREDVEPAVALALLFSRILRKNLEVLPVTAHVDALFAASDQHGDREGEPWPRLKELLYKKAVLRMYENPDGGKFRKQPYPEQFGAGRDTFTVLAQAISAVTGFETRPEQALCRAVNHNGRSALTGAIAGALLGAQNGVPGLPQEWLRNLGSRYLVQDIGSDVYWTFDYWSAHSYAGAEWDVRYPVP